MGKFRLKEEKLHRVRLGSRYFGFNLAQFSWECLKLVAASERLRETDIIRRMISSWVKTLPAAIREKARAEAERVEAWKVQELSARRNGKRQTKRAEPGVHRARFPEKGSPESSGSPRRHRQKLAAD